MATPHTRWMLSFGWILAAAVLFFALDASSVRSWMYLAIAALVPPTVLLSLWPATPARTIGDVMRETGGRS